MIHLGIFAGSFSWVDSEGPVLAIFGFLAGVIISTTYHTRRRHLGLRVRPHVLVWVEASLIFALALGLHLSHHEFSTAPSHTDLFFVTLGALAMGIQTTALRRVRTVQIATTYGTGTIVRIGEKFVSHLAERDPVLESTGGLRNVPVVILVTVLVSYIGGAALASRLGSQHLLLLGPALALAVAGTALKPS